MKTSKLNLGNKDDWEPEVEGMDHQPTGNAGLSLETSSPVERRESQRRGAGHSFGGAISL